jgi:L-ribulose-5-phosphate 3-epimerase
MYRFGYNTNGLAHHRLPDAFRLLADLGYRGVAITPDVAGLDPLHLREGEVEGLARLAQDLDLELSIETGARFLLDPTRKHGPNLLDASAESRARRVEFYKGCVDLASGLSAPLISLWSGCADDRRVFDEVDECARAQMLERLAEGLRPVLDHAGASGVRVAFEPEPGMFVERVEEYRALAVALGDRGSELGLTIDVGHLVVTGEPLVETIEGAADVLVHVHLDDARVGVHEHLMFGQGDLDLPATLSALQRIGFEGLAAVELSRDSYRGHEAAEQALQRLREAQGQDSAV